MTSLPAELRDSGGFAIDADGSAAYWGVGFGEQPRPVTSDRRADQRAGQRRAIGRQNLDPHQDREAARRRFELNGRGPDGIRRIDLMFNLMAHLPYLAHKPSGVAVINLRTDAMRILGQGRGQGFWHCNGSPDGRWAVADDFLGDITLIDRRSGELTVLTTGHVMRPDHTHPIFSPDSSRVLIQSGRPSDGRVLDLMLINVPAGLRDRQPAIPQPA